MRRTLSVRLSVCPSVPLLDEVFLFDSRTVLRANIQNRKTSVFAYGPASRMYFSARAEGRISYGHLGRTNSCFYHIGVNGLAYFCIRRVFITPAYSTEYGLVIVRTFRSIIKETQPHILVLDCLTDSTGNCYRLPALLRETAFSAPVKTYRMSPKTIGRHFPTPRVPPAPFTNVSIAMHCL